MTHPTPVPTGHSKLNKEQIRNIAPRVISLLLNEKRHLIIGGFALIAASSINLLIPYLAKVILNQDSSPDVTLTLAPALILASGIFLLQGILFYFRHFHLQVIGLKIATKLRGKLQHAFLNQSISFFDQSRLGDLMSRLSSDCDQIQKGLSTNISVVLRYSIQIIGGTIMMFVIAPMLSLAIILVIPLMSLVSIVFSKKLKKKSKAVQESLSECSVLAEEALSGIRIVKLFSNENLELNNYRTKLLDAEDKSIDRTRLAAAFSSSMSSFLNIVIACIFILGFFLIDKGSMDVGELTAFVMYCAMVAISFGFLINAWSEFLQSLGAAERVYEIIDGDEESQPISPVKGPVKSAENSPSNASHFDESISISFHNVSFHYPSRSDLFVLKNISFTMPANATTALVGPSGAGKSTLAFLIPLLYKPTSGNIYFNDIDTQGITLQELRKQVAFVPQNPHLFSSSIRENILYGSSDTSINLESILKDSALQEFLSRLPEGLDTLVGDKGIQLSGGERQRIAIARALVRNPKILVLDEATSALDSHNEALVQTALETASLGRTTLVIAHRLSTVKNADQVIVLNSGEIEQIGKHQDLMNETGLYKSLVQTQLLSPDIGSPSQASRSLS